MRLLLVAARPLTTVLLKLLDEYTRDPVQRPPPLFWRELVAYVRLGSLALARISLTLRFPLPFVGAGGPSRACGRTEPGLRQASAALRLRAKSGGTALH